MKSKIGRGILLVLGGLVVILVILQHTVIPKILWGVINFGILCLGIIAILIWAISNKKKGGQGEMNKKSDEKLSKEKVEEVLDKFFMVFNALRKKKKLQKIELGLILFFTGMLGCFISVVFLSLEKISAFLLLFIGSLIVWAYGGCRAQESGNLRDGFLDYLYPEEDC